jgi:hypothetical protein
MDNKAVGFWFLGGGVLPKDVNADMKWLGDNGFAACVVGTDENRLVAPGIIDTSIADWYSAKSHETNTPYRMLLSWQEPRQPNMLWNRLPLPYMSPDPGTVAYPDFHTQRNQITNAFVPVPAADPYTLNFRKQMAAYAAADPNFMGHHGEAELGGTGLVELSRYTGIQATNDAWHNYLQNSLGLTLASAGQRYRGNPKGFARWDDIPVPRMTDFLGWGSGSVDLSGTWDGRSDKAKAGSAAKWYAEGAPTDWVKVESNDPILMCYSGANANSAGDYWLRRSFDLTAEQAGRDKWLHVSRDGWHSGGRLKVETAYVNGIAIKDLTVDHPLWGDDDQCFDLGSALQAGTNKIVLKVHGPFSYVFLSASGRWLYPSADKNKNNFFYDGIDFSSVYKLKTLENNLKATRAGDPNRPIKIMAPWSFMDRIADLCTRYGAYPHDTGQGAACWGPWLGRYTSWKGIISSSEPGGPAGTPQELRQHMTFYLMLGNSIVDEVFHASEYREKPEMAKWVADNREMLRCIGKMDMPQPAIGVLRSLRNARMGQHELWSWDMARGEAQAAGRTADYVDLPDFTNGTASKFRVIIDDATAIMTPQDVAAITRYVAAGGIFVALHNTGSATPDAANTWPISELTGLRVVNSSIGNQDVTFDNAQSLFPSFRGQTVRGWGSALDWKQIDTGGTGVAQARIDPAVKIIATWAKIPADKGNIAVATRKIGKGLVVTLGSSFWRDARDLNGHWVSRSDVLNEFLTALGVPRDSWVTGDQKDVNQEVWAERWRSKNGVFDLYPVARINTDGSKPPIAADIRISTGHAVAAIREVSTPGAPSVDAKLSADSFTLPRINLGPMESRVYASTRPDVENAVDYWLATQQRQWPSLAPVPASALPPAPPVATDTLALADGWRMALSQTGDDWTKSAYDDHAWKTVKLGSFAAMHLPEDSTAQFRRTVTVPKAWAGQRLTLIFNSQDWFWGLQARAKLWINGQPAPIKSVTADQVGSFVIDATPLVVDGKLTLALEIDGRLGAEFRTFNTGRRLRPAGATGIFLLQAAPRPVKTSPLVDGWMAATDVNVLAPVPVGKPVTYSYLENRFTLPSIWPGKRLLFESPDRMGWIILNGNVIAEPPTARALDISRLVRRSGENVLRWVPGPAEPPAPNRTYTKPVQELNLAWYP